MEDFITWGTGVVVANKEWLFSGVGVVVLACIGRFFFNKRSASLTQTIKSGNSSSNVQVGRDVNIGMKKTTKDVEEE
ncbi:hypothetical protein GCM10008090_23120 [Arenicella chitinivorans]|uniref:Uncharacterized protein n=1 Tax=Arenicella chitinivorans TaxID=1329800 RepID=A0A918RV88_9GAMM|nr:hypothetical protein [Arenicella chitinivorans]GHA12580.1 hypothetical protein GCM10008090_23120 [Arenicella chitinivorans]